VPLVGTRATDAEGAGGDKLLDGFAAFVDAATMTMDSNGAVNTIDGYRCRTHIGPFAARLPPQIFTKEGDPNAPYVSAQTGAFAVGGEDCVELI
jgi:hypothetical protein